MEKINQTKSITYFFLVLFLSGSAYLSVVDSRYDDPRYNSGWYAVSFTDPKSGKSDFTIENFSSRTDFHWEVLAGDERISQGDAAINSGEKKGFDGLETVSGKKTTVRISNGESVQEIYKNITD